MRSFIILSLFCVLSLSNSFVSLSVSAPYAAIREGPGTLYAVRATVQRGKQYALTGENIFPVNGFYKVDADRYIAASAVTASKSSLPSSNSDETSIMEQKLLHESLKTNSEKEQLEVLLRTTNTAEIDKTLESVPRPITGTDLIYYSQLDDRWKDKSYSAVGTEGQTMGSSGCGPTTAAMIVAQWKDKSVTPNVLADFAIQNGYRTVNSGTSWEFFSAVAKKYGLTVVQTTVTDAVVLALENGSLVVASMGKGYWTNAGHYILLYKNVGDEIYAHDPASVARTKATIDSFKTEGRNYFIFSK